MKQERDGEAEQGRQMGGAGWAEKGALSSEDPHEWG